MKKDYLNIIIGVGIGLFAAWLLGMFTPMPPAQPAVATTPPAVSAPAQSATPAKPVANTVVVAPTTPPAQAQVPVKPAPSTPANAQLAAQQDAMASQVRQQSQVKAMTNNLRQLSMAAEQYMLDKGVTSANYFDLVGSGTDNYLRQINPVMGEDYSGFMLNQTDTQVMIVAPDGTMVTYNL